MHGVVNEVANSFGVINPQPIQGGKDEPTIEEIRELIAANFASQSRVVTIEDFIVRSLSMPSKFGSIFRAHARVSPTNQRAVELYVLSRDSDGFATTAPTPLKKNLKRYLSRFRMATDAIEIMDVDVINLGIDFAVLTMPDFSNNEVVVNCIEVLRDFVELDKMQINQPLNLTDVHRILADVDGVMSVISIEIINKVGTIGGRSYSDTPYNISENIRNNILYSEENKIFEVKYPQFDIRGVAK